MDSVKAKKKPRLTKKQRGFVKDYALTENGVQSALKNYEVEDYKTASVIASENLDKPYIVDAINDIKKTVAESLSEELLLKVHLEGLSAMKMDGKGGMMIGLNGEGKAESFGHTEMQMPDYAVRHKYLDSAYKLKGSYAPEKSQAVNLNIDASLKGSERVKSIQEEYEAKLKQELLKE